MKRPPVSKRTLKIPIEKTLKQVENCIKDGYYQEALLNIYHLNLSLIRHLSSELGAGNQPQLKPKDVLNRLNDLVKTSPSAKAVIKGANIKSLKAWTKKTDSYFKTLRIKKPLNTRTLFHESEKIFLLLNISNTKLSARK